MKNRPAECKGVSKSDCEKFMEGKKMRSALVKRLSIITKPTNLKNSKKLSKIISLHNEREINKQIAEIERIGGASKQMLVEMHTMVSLMRKVAIAKGLITKEGDDFLRNSEHIVQMAINPKTSKKILFQLAFHPIAEIRARAISNENFPEPLLIREMIVTDPSVMVRRAAKLALKK